MLHNSRSARLTYTTVYGKLEEQKCFSLVIGLDSLAVLRTKKELPVLEHRSRGCVPLISHPYDDSLACLLRHCDPYDLQEQSSITRQLHMHIGEPTYTFIVLITCSFNSKARLWLRRCSLIE
jgi:hypothetical protein